MLNMVSRYLWFTMLVDNKSVDKQPHRAYYVLKGLKINMFKEEI